MEQDAKNIEVNTEPGILIQEKQKNISEPQRKKIVLIILTLLAVCCGIFFVLYVDLYLSHLSKSTSNILSIIPIVNRNTNKQTQFQLYKATDYMGGEVSFQYPSSLEKQPEANGWGEERRQVFSSTNLPYYVEFDRNFSCTFMARDKQLPVTSVEDCVTSSPQQPLTKIIIDNRELITFTATVSANEVGEGNESTDFTAVFLSKDKLSEYSLYMHINSTDFQVIQRGKDIFNKILLSLSFTTPDTFQSTIDTTNWKTYKNKDFTFQYPNTWETEGYDFFEVGKPHIHPGAYHGGNEVMTVLINQYDADETWKNLHNTVDFPEYASFKETTIAGKRAMIKPELAIIWYGVNNKIRVELDASDHETLQTILSTIKFTN